MSSSSAKTDRREAAGEPIEVGRVLRAHGVRGELLIEARSDNRRRFAAGSELTAVRDGRPLGRFVVERAHPHPAGLRVALSGLADRTAAAGLVGADLEADRGTVPPAAPGTYYGFELVGCRCRDRQAGDLGEVVDVVEDGGGWLLEIAQEDRRLLVPYVASFLLAVDRSARIIELDLPAGLIETCTSPS